MKKYREIFISDTKTLAINTNKDISEINKALIYLDDISKKKDKQIEKRDQTIRSLVKLHSEYLDTMNIKGVEPKTTKNAKYMNREC